MQTQLIQLNTTELLIVLIAAVVLVAIGTAGVILTIRHARHPYLLIEQRRMLLIKPVQLDSSLWLELDDETLNASYATVAPYGDHAWVITVAPQGFMWVDGLRSRRNRLHDGAQVILGKAGKATFTYVEPMNGRVVQKENKKAPANEY